MEYSPFIDSHFHLIQSMEKGLGPSELMIESVEAGVRAGMDIAVDLENLDLRREACRKYPGLGYTIGLYPSFAARDSPGIDILETELKKRSGDPLLWALGEIGLDFHWNYGSPEKQKELLLQQIELARSYDLPVVIHNRMADVELYEILAENPVRGIMHCFSSDGAVMRKFLDLGLYISFAGNLTFKNAITIREAASEVPLDRVLFETDSPYLSPQPVRGKINRPKHVVHIYQFFAELRQIPLAELKQQVCENFRRAVPRSRAGSA